MRGSIDILTGLMSGPFKYLRDLREVDGLCLASVSQPRSSEQRTMCSDSAQPRRNSHFMKKRVRKLTGERTATICLFAGRMLHSSKLYSVPARMNTFVDA